MSKSHIVHGIGQMNVNVQIFSRYRSKLIATVISHVRSRRYNFSIVTDSSNVLPDIALVEFSDPEAQASAARLLERCHCLQIVELVTAKDQLQGNDSQLSSAHLVSDLIPMLEYMADNRASGGMDASMNPRTPTKVVGAKVIHLPTKVHRTRLRALVVDDSPTVRDQLAITVERLGLRCDTAESGAAALDMLEENAYQIVYVDVVMPDMDGYRLTREIKRNRAHKGIPVIILTSKSSPFDRARGALAGCETYLTKPVELKRFFEATRNCLVKNRAVADSFDWITDPTMPSQSAQSFHDAPSASPDWGGGAEQRVGQRGQQT